MNILYIHQYFQVNSGGTRSFEFSKYLAEEGNNVTILTGNKVNINQYDGIDIISTNTQYKQGYSFIKRVYAFLHFMIKSILLGIKQKDTDIIFATSTPLTIGVTGLLVSKILKKKYVFEVRDVWPDIPIQLGFIKNKLVIKMLSKLELLIYKHAAHIIVLSTGMRNNLIEKGVPSDKISVITNLANNHLVEEIDMNKKDILKQYPFLKDKFVCIHSGTMGFVNGLEHILEIANDYRNDNIVYLLIGEGKEKERLKMTKESHGLDNVYILDQMSKAEVLKLVKFSDVGIMSVSDYKILQDNSANKFFDYLAAGKPIILNYLGWQNEVLRKGSAGKGFKYQDRKEYYSYLRELKENKGLYEETSRNAKKLAQTHYDSVKLSQKLYGILKEI
ncbi:glycosyltransferase family 4 protein [Bacillus sp. DX4.1]|uniref:glycosyltransferase family 4 protein n=1 Tax=Bacillus sp. DX4.1 TaxID=3055867 RepID=UPI0025A2F279|nr:glycosyltransferase family 4 protein [Bacillus sp. DX4.1]MDM5190876.1 glycosyltransferase family 4 protein [Bacillus sp. DX4.1]